MTIEVALGHDQHVYAWFVWASADPSTLDSFVRRLNDRIPLADPEAMAREYGVQPPAGKQAILGAMAVLGRNADGLHDATIATLRIAFRDENPYVRRQALFVLSHATSDGRVAGLAAEALEHESDPCMRQAFEVLRDEGG